jgi:hypothetical protein
MKKLTLILVVLLTIGLVGAFADATVSGKLQHQAIGDGETFVGTWGTNELYFDADVDDYNSVHFALDGIDQGTPGVHDFYVSTDVTGALGLDAPVSLSTKIGRFDNWISGFSYVTNRGHEYTWPGKLAQADNGAIMATIGFDPVNVYALHDFNDNFMFGADASVAGANLYVNYGGTYTAPSEGTVGIDANYTLDIDDMTSVYVPASFEYHLVDETYEWSSGVKGTYDMATLGVGVGGNDTDMLQTVDADLNVAATENANVFAVGVFNLVDSYNTMEFGASYAFGALTLQAGYVVDADEQGHDTYNFGSVTGSAFYLNSSISF